MTTEKKGPILITREQFAAMGWPFYDYCNDPKTSPNFDPTKAVTVKTCHCCYSNKQVCNPCPEELEKGSFRCMNCHNHPERICEYRKPGKVGRIPKCATASAEKFPSNRRPHDGSSDESESATKKIKRAYTKRANSTSQQPLYSTSTGSYVTTDLLSPVQYTVNGHGHITFEAPPPLSGSLNPNPALAKSLIPPPPPPPLVMPDGSLKDISVCPPPPPPPPTSWIKSPTMINRPKWSTTPCRQGTPCRSSGLNSSSTYDDSDDFVNFGGRWQPTTPCWNQPLLMSPASSPSSMDVDDMKTPDECMMTKASRVEDIRVSPVMSPMKTYVISRDVLDSIF